jgi:hypothetical protein
LILPQSNGAAGQWTLYDYGRKRVTSAASANGQAVATVAEVPQDELWLIDLVRVKTDEPTASAVSTAYVCLDDPEFDVIGTATGSYDVADQNAPIQAPGGSLVLIVWKGAANGTVGKAYVQWTVLKSAMTSNLGG